MSNSYDIAIVGAGPAGMAAAIRASKAGASVVILDEKAEGGGVIYKNVCNSPLPDPSKMGVEYTNGRELVEEFNKCSAEKLFEASIWHVGENGEILFTRHKQTHCVSAKEIIVCSGSMERPFPVPGWELSGVMSAGSAQVMLKSEALVREDAVFAGTGPLLYLIVAQYIRLGVKVKALIDTTPTSGYISATPKFPGAVSQTPMLMKGIGMLGSIYKAGVPVYRSAQNIRIEGKEGVTAIRFKSGSKEHVIDTNHVFLHQGVIPNLNITKALNLKHEWSEQQLCWSPKIDHWGQSSAIRISVAGDCSKVVGAEGSIAMGNLSALNLLSRLGHITETQRNTEAEPHLRKLKQQANFRKFIDALYRPLDVDRIPQAPETIVCRCEEVTLAQLKEGFEKGARDPSAMKVLTRSGMGPCQGRQCGHTVTELLSKWRGEPAQSTGYYNLRSPGRLLNLTELSKFSKIEPKTTAKAGGVQ